MQLGGRRFPSRRLSPIGLSRTSHRVVAKIQSSSGRFKLRARAKCSGPKAQLGAPGSDRPRRVRETRRSRGRSIRCPPVTSTTAVACLENGDHQLVRLPSERCAPIRFGLPTVGDRARNHSGNGDRLYPDRLGSDPADCLSHPCTPRGASNRDRLHAMSGAAEWGQTVFDTCRFPFRPDGQSGSRFYRARRFPTPGDART